MTDIKNMISEMEGQTFEFVPVNPLLKPILVTVRDGKVYRSDNDTIHLVGIRWDYVYSCFKGAPDPSFIPGTTPVTKHKSKSLDTNQENTTMEQNEYGGDQQPVDQGEAQLTTKTHKPKKEPASVSDGQFITLPEWDQKDPPPMKDGNEQFWCQSSVKQVFILFKDHLGGVNGRGEDLNDVLGDIVNQFGDVAKDSLAIVPTDHLQKLLEWMQGLVPNDQWTNTLKRTTLAILKRLVRYKVKYGW